MLSREDNELMCRVGPDTAMGKAMRRFWLPACTSAELPEPDGDPLHIELLGENFVAFRDSNGNVGLLDEHCCHRGASLTVGRVEGCGIRCIYHGWLFAADGTVLETPNVQDPRFKDRFKAPAYPVREAGGLVWTYIGPSEAKPAFPDFDFNESSPEMRLTRVAVVNCNYVQVLEGLLDSSHLSVLHSSALAAPADPNLPFAQVTSHMQFDAAPQIESEETDFGLHYAAVRNVDGKAETRVAAFLSPCWIRNPNADLTLGCVPMGDERTAFYHIWYDGEKRFGEEPLHSQQQQHVGLDQPTLEAHGMTRATAKGPKAMSRANGFHQDRFKSREGHFTGMASFTQEDALVSVSGGAIRDRSKERLSTADLPIAHLYRVLLKSARGAAAGSEPLFLNQSVARIRGAHAQLETGSDWRVLVPDHRPLKAA